MHQGADGSLSEDHINILSAGSLDVQGPAGPWGLGAGWECGVLGPWEGAGAAPRPPGPCSPRLQSPPGPRRCTRPPGHPATRPPPITSAVRPPSLPPGPPPLVGTTRHRLFSRPQVLPGPRGSTAAWSLVYT